MELLLVIAVSVAATAAYPMQSYHIFMGCHNSVCSMNGIYGFHCKNGICSYICSEVGCRHDGLMSRPIMDKPNLIFYGCTEVSCSVDGFYGYGCIAGICHYICSDSGCVDVNWVKQRVKCPSRPARKKAEKTSKVESKTPKEANIKIVQDSDKKQVDLEEQSSTENGSEATEFETTSVPKVRKDEKWEGTTEDEQLERASPTKRPIEEPAEPKEASGKPDVSTDATSVVETVESSVKDSEVDKVISENQKKAAAPSEQDGKSKSSKKAPRKKRLSRRPKRKQDQGSGEQVNVNKPLDFSL